MKGPERSGIIPGRDRSRDRDRDGIGRGSGPGRNQDGDGMGSDGQTYENRPSDGQLIAT